MRSLGAARGGNRTGAVVVEILVALALMSVLGAALLRSLDRQARFHRSLLTILETRAQLASTHNMLAAELRGIAGPAGDLARLSDSAVVYRTVIGTGLTCLVAGDRAELVADAATGQTLAGMRSAPQPGDSIWLLDEGAGVGPGDDSWFGVQLRSASPLAAACPGTVWVDSVAAGRKGWRLQFDSAPLPHSITAGAPALITRPARFALYRSSSGDYNLGWSDWRYSSGGWNVIQPVSGPFLPYMSPPLASGVGLEGRTSSGSALSSGNTEEAAGISIALRAITSEIVRIDGLPRERHADSARSYISLRNRQ